MSAVVTLDTLIYRNLQESIEQIVEKN